MATEATRRIGPARLTRAYIPGERTVLLVHGYGSTGSLTWAENGWERSLVRLGYGVLIPDLRGHGGSDKPVDPTGYSPALFAGDLVALLDELGLDEVDVVAHSMGGIVALALAESSPDRVRSLVLCGTGLSDPFGTRDLEAERRFLLEGVPMDDPRQSALLEAALRVPGADPAAIAAIAAGMVGQRVTSVPRVPTLVVGGDRDRLAVDTAEYAARIGARHLAVAGRGHFDVLRDPVVFDRVADFLEEVSP